MTKVSLIAFEKFLLEKEMAGLEVEPGFFYWILKLKDY
jgi:hypothetical protein